MRTILLLIFGFGVLWSQSSPIYVASPKGLSLREKPSQDSKRIELLEYGTTLTHYKRDDNSATIDGYNGSWLQVSTEDGKTGFVFEGYTLPFMVPKESDLDQYLISIFGKIVFTDSIINKSDGDDYLDKKIYHYKNGVIRTIAGMYESYEESLINLKLDAEKAYLFYWLLEEYCMGKQHLLPTINYPQKETKLDTIVVEKNNYHWGSLYIDKADGAFYWVKIFWFSGSIGITWGSGV